MQNVKQEIESIVLNPRKLLGLSLASLFESSRKHPGKFQALYYNLSSHLSVEQILLQSFISENEDEKFLLDEAERKRLEAKRLLAFVSQLGLVTDF